MLTPFNDVISHWAEMSIAASVDAGLFEGVMFATLKKYASDYPDGSFGPQNYATRAEVATIMDRYLTPEVSN